MSMAAGGYSPVNRLEMSGSTLAASWRNRCCVDCLQAALTLCSTLRVNNWEKARVA